jgi:hypothetical protein
MNRRQHEAAGTRKQRQRPSIETTARFIACCIVAVDYSGQFSCKGLDRVDIVPFDNLIFAAFVVRVLGGRPCLT